jgi:hypothetical protein
MKIEDIRRYIEMNIKDVTDVTASRIYEVMTGFTASTKEDDGSIRLITDEAVANLLTLFNRPVGIGEHTDFMVEINKWVEQGSAAVDKIQFLANVFGQGEDSTVVPNTTPDVPQERVETSVEGGL